MFNLYICSYLYQYLLIDLLFLIWFVNWFHISWLFVNWVFLWESVDTKQGLSDLNFPPITFCMKLDCKLCQWIEWYIFLGEWRYLSFVNLSVTDSECLFYSGWQTATRGLYCRQMQYYTASFNWAVIWHWTHFYCLG